MAIAKSTIAAITAIILNPWFLVGLTVLSCYLLNAPVKLIALKFKTWDFKTNSNRYLLIILSVAFLVTFQFLGIPLILLTYILLSFISN